MLIAVLTIGGVATVITLAALMARKSTEAAQPPLKRDPVEGDPDEKNKVKPINPPADDQTGGTNTGEILGKVKAELGGLIAGVKPYLPEPEKPEEPEPVGPSPYEPSPVPRPGDYYQVVLGDTLWEIARAAYDSGPRYDEIVAAPENNWIRKTGNSKWGGGLYPRYSGWNTPWDSGHQFPVVWVP
jgi:nucleoid-associated protein YgaU